MNHKRALLTFLSLGLGGLLLIATVNALLDPYHILHRPFWGQPRFSTNQRFQNAGLINSYLAADLGFDSVIIGTSLEDCYDVGRIQKRLGTARVLNLAVDSSTPLERGAIVERALETGKVRHVLWGVYENYADSVADRENTGYLFPFDLYRAPYSIRGLGAVIHYLLNASVLNESLTLAMGRSRWSTDLDGVYDWTAGNIKSRNFERFSNPDSMARHARSVADGKAAIALARQNLERARTMEFPALEKHLVQVVLRHPEVRFDLVLSPVSALFFHTLSPENLLRQMGLRLRLVRALGQAPNVRIFAFDDDWAVTENLANYRDPFHVNFHANERVVDAMAAGSRRLTPATVEGYVTRLLARLQGYQVFSDRGLSLWGAGNASGATQ